MKPLHYTTAEQAEPSLSQMGTWPLSLFQARMQLEQAQGPGAPFCPRRATPSRPALPASRHQRDPQEKWLADRRTRQTRPSLWHATAALARRLGSDRKSTRLNSSHVEISYAV